jgi:hypothetical protein
VSESLPYKFVLIALDDRQDSSAGIEPMDGQLVSLTSAIGPAVLAKDRDGYCVYANQAAEALWGLKAGVLEGKYITELAAGDPRLTEAEFHRLIRDGSWVGQYPICDANSALVSVKAFAFTHSEPSGRLLYVTLYYRLSDSELPQYGPTQITANALTCEDLCLGQLCLIGYSDEQIAQLFGETPEQVALRITEMIAHMSVSSRTEACVRMLKAGLLA